MKVHRVLPILGLPVSDLTFDETLEEIVDMIEAGRPDFVATVNLDHAMRCRDDRDFRDALCRARIVTADGMPLIWASRLKGESLRERVTGADLLPETCRLAAERGYRVFLLGGEPGIADCAAERLMASYPGLRIVGTYSPAFAPLEGLNHAEMCDVVRRARPDLLFTSLGSPKGTLWLERHLEALDVPVCLEVGAAFSFAARVVCRAPRWMRASGGEWAFRMLQEPGRLSRRYRANAAFLMGRLWSHLSETTARRTERTTRRGQTSIPTPQPPEPPPDPYPSERRQQPRGVYTEADTWRVTRSIADRMARGAAVEADLRSVDLRRTNVVGAVVWLYRRAVREQVALTLHGMPGRLLQAPEELGGRQWADWIASCRPTAGSGDGSTISGEHGEASPSLDPSPAETGFESWHSEQTGGLLARPSHTTGAL